MIREVIVTTLNADGRVHIAPMGIREADGLVVIAPFKPSTTLENLQREQTAVVNLTDDVRVFAGCLTGHYDWPATATEKINGMRLRDCPAHMELRVQEFIDDSLRPQFHCRVEHQASHRPFRGFNRAQAAVLECAILVSRLHMLPADKVDNELQYLEIAVEKTAGPQERLAWQWLQERITDFRRQQKAGEQAQ